jgi:MFS family permease
MAGYFGGVLVGRTLGSRLARRYGAARLLAIALGVTAAGFGVLWPSTAPVPSLAGLSLLGIGLGNLFPMGVSLAVALAPGQSALASGRVVAMSSFAVVLAPLTVGTLADVTSLKMALGVVPVMVVLAAAGLTLVARTQARIATQLKGPVRPHVPSATSRCRLHVEDDCPSLSSCPRRADEGRISGKPAPPAEKVTGTRTYRFAVREHQLTGKKRAFK